MSYAILRYFLFLLASVACETILLLTITVIYIIEVFGGFGNISQRGNFELVMLKVVLSLFGPYSASSAFQTDLGDQIIGLKIILIIACAIIGSVVALVLQLVVFHIMLCK